MSLYETLLNLFTDRESHEAYQEDPEGYLGQQGLQDITSQDIQAEMPRVLTALQGNTGGATQGGTASFAGSGNVVLPPPPGGGGGGGGVAEGGLTGAIESINHYTNVLNETNQVFQDNDTTVIDDRDTTVDNSVNQNINAFGDVNQEFDNDVVSGDGAVAAGDDAQVNTGDGAVQAGGDIIGSTVATGDVGGSVTGDVDDSIVGDGNQAIIDSQVGAASFGEGDATNVSAQNANVGDGVQVVGGAGDTTANVGGGDLTQIDADDGAAVAFGEGSSAQGDNQDVDIFGPAGNVQVAGDDSTQVVDQSTDVDVADSFNDQSVNDSYNLDQSDDDFIDVDDSGNTDDHSDDDVVDIA
jgi:hypothetical protein